MFEVSIRVIYGDTDQMGVVYCANHFCYFEQEGDGNSWIET